MQDPQNNTDPLPFLLRFLILFSFSFFSRSRRAFLSLRFIFSTRSFSSNSLSRLAFSMISISFFSRSRLLRSSSNEATFPPLSSAASPRLGAFACERRLALEMVMSLSSSKSKNLEFPLSLCITVGSKFIC